MGTVNHVIRDFLPPMRRQTVHKNKFLSSGREPGIDLII